MDKRNPSTVSYLTLPKAETIAASAPVYYTQTALGSLYYHLSNRRVTTRPHIPAR